MKVVTVASTKGGVGKSTLVCALAVCAVEEGHKVAIIDVDSQGSTRDWHALRSSPDQPCLLAGDSIDEMLDEARAMDMAFVLIDTPPGGVASIEAAVRQADFVLVPVRPSPLDLLAQDAIVGLVEVHERPWAFVLNQVPPRTTFAEEATKALKKVGRVLAQVIGARNTFATAMAHGKTAPEAERGDGKSRDEIAAVWQAVKRQLRNARS